MLRGAGVLGFSDSRCGFAWSRGFWVGDLQMSLHAFHETQTLTPN